MIIFAKIRISTDYTASITQNVQPALKEDVSYYLYSCCDRSNVYALHYPGNEIQVFNWEGDYIKKINIDRNLICISISPSGILYGTDMDGQIVRYELN